MKVQSLIVVLVSGFVVSAWAFPSTPLVSELDITSDGGPILIVLDESPSVERAEENSEMADEVEDFVVNSSQELPNSKEGTEKKPVVKPQKPESKPEKPESKPVKPESKPQKPVSKPQKPESKPQKPGNKPQKPGNKPQKPKPAGKPKPDHPQRPMNKPQRPGKPLKPQKPGQSTFLETDISNEEEYSSTYLPDYADYDYTTLEPDFEVEETTIADVVVEPSPTAVSDTQS